MARILVIGNGMVGSRFAAELQDRDVRAAACAVREDVPGVSQIVGYVVSRNGPVDEERLRAQLRQRLPSHMVPTLIETIRDLPRLPSGKLDRADAQYFRCVTLACTSGMQGSTKHDPE